MAPEYGATAGFFPVDEETTRYLRLTGRDEKLVAAVEQYYRLQGMWRDDSRDVIYSSMLQLDMSSVVPSLAGPRRPQDRIDLGDMKTAWQHEMATGFAGKGATKGTVVSEGESFDLGNGDVVIAAITSCTNTSNPFAMVGAGLVARKAREGPEPQAVGEDLACSGIKGGDGLFGEGRAHRRSRGSRVLPRRIRMHLVHRQFRTAARPDQRRGPLP